MILHTLWQVLHIFNQVLGIIIMGSICCLPQKKTFPYPTWYNNQCGPGKEPSNFWGYDIFVMSARLLTIPMSDQIVYNILICIVLFLKIQNFFGKCRIASDICRIFSSIWRFSFGTYRIYFCMCRISFVKNRVSSLAKLFWDIWFCGTHTSIVPYYLLCCRRRILCC